jgi:hypothetical protein
MPNTVEDFAIEDRGTCMDTSCGGTPSELTMRIVALYVRSRLCCLLLLHLKELRASCHINVSALMLTLGTTLCLIIALKADDWKT